MIAELHHSPEQRHTVGTATECHDVALSLPEQFVPFYKFANFPQHLHCPSVIKKPPLFFCYYVLKTSSVLLSFTRRRVRVLSGIRLPDGRC